MFFFFVKQKSAYDMRISDWSSDVCSSYLPATCPVGRRRDARDELPPVDERPNPALDTLDRDALQTEIERGLGERIDRPGCFPLAKDANRRCNGRSAERRVGKECVSTFRSGWST